MPDALGSEWSSYILRSPTSRIDPSLLSLSMNLFFVFDFVRGYCIISCLFRRWSEHFYARTHDAYTLAIRITIARWSRDSGFIFFIFFLLVIRPLHLIPDGVTRYAYHARIAIVFMLYIYTFFSYNSYSGVGWGGLGSHCCTFDWVISSYFPKFFYPKPP